MPDQVITPVEPTVQPATSPVAAPIHKQPTKGPVVLLMFLFLVALGAGVFYFINKSKPPSTEPIALVATPAPAVLTLTLMSPVEGELAVDDEALVRGTTLPNTTVVIFTEGDEVTTESDATGNFESTIKLNDGINTLVVTAFGEDGQEMTKNLSLVYDAST